MAKKKTSAEVAREQSEIAKVEGMLGDAFGGLGGLEQPTPEANVPEDSMPEGSEDDNETTISDQTPAQESQEVTETPTDGTIAEPEEEVTISEETDSIDETERIPPSGPPSKPPSGPPSGPPPSLTTTDDKPKAPATPPAKPPTGPPSGPPAKAPTGPPTGPPSKPPTGPPSGPPSKPPTGPPSGTPDDPPTDSEEDDTTLEVVDEDAKEEVEDVPAEAVDENDDITTETDDEAETEALDDITEVKSEEKETDESTQDSTGDSESVEPVSSQELVDLVEDSSEDIEGVEDIMSKEAEIARLSAEVERLRNSMTGAADIIEEMENPPMPPVVHEDLVIGAHIVADMARMARQLDRDKLVRASMGTIAMLHPDRLDVLISTKNKALLPRMNEQDLCAGKLNADPPRGAPADWRVLEVLLASTSIVTGGPAAVIHCHGPYSTAVSCEKDLVLMQPIDNLGKDNIGKVIIVDPDDENPREYLRQVAEALNQGGMRCVVIRGNGAYAVGADLDQAWANAAMLEHSMKIVMLARQANLKI